MPANYPKFGECVKAFLNFRRFDLKILKLGVLRKVYTDLGGEAHAVDGEHKRLIAEWVARGLEKPGKSQSGLARALGITQPNVYRLLNGERSLRAEEIATVANYLDRPFPWHQISISDGAITEEIAGGQMPVVGRVQAGVWVEHDHVDEALGFIPFARDPAFPASRRQYAVQVTGDSMDKVLPDGSYAIVMAADGQLPKHNDLVIVKRIMGHLIERTVKRYVENAAGGELHPESSNPKHTVLRFDGTPEATFEIEGFVIGRYQRL